MQHHVNSQVIVFADEWVCVRVHDSLNAVSTCALPGEIVCQRGERKGELFTCHGQISPIFARFIRVWLDYKPGMSKINRSPSHVNAVYLFKHLSQVRLKEAHWEKQMKGKKEKNKLDLTN